MKKNDSVEIFKVLFTPENDNLISRIYNVFNSGETLTHSLKLLLGVATKNVTRERLKNIAPNTDGNHLIYVAVSNNKIVCTFTHIYDHVSNEMYLNESIAKNTGLGYGTKAYEKIMPDIFETFKVEDICADATTDAGRKFLQKMGFYPNVNPYSYGGNSILYSPTTKLKFSKFKIRLEKLLELSPLRNLANAPNVDAYNDEMHKLILSGDYDEESAVKFFNKVQKAYRRKRITPQLKNPKQQTMKLKKPNLENPHLQELNTLFTVQKTPIEEYDPNESEINYNLKILQTAQNKDKGKE